MTKYLIALLVEAADDIPVEELLGIKDDLVQEWMESEDGTKLEGLLIARGKKARKVYQLAEAKLQGNEES